MTRTVMVGEPDRHPAADARRGRRGPGRRASPRCGRASTAADVDAACRAVIAEAGWADAFVHGTGHGVGLEIHEAPRVGATADCYAGRGHVVTVEPGVYLPEHGGVRIEDTVVVTADGLPHRSRWRPKELVPLSRHRHRHDAPTRRTHGHHHQRPEERHDPRPRRGPVPGRRVPARQAGQGRRLRAHHAQNVRTGRVLDRTFRAGEKVEQAIIDKREMQYLYRDGDDYVFMDNETYDQLHVRPGDRSATPPTTSSRASTMVLQMYERRDRRRRPARRGRARRSPRPSPASRATGCRAPASRPRSRPGLVVQVPLFVNTGDRIKVDTRTGEYLTRA